MKPVHIRLPLAQRRSLTALRLKSGRSVAWIIRQAVAAYLRATQETDIVAPTSTHINDIADPTSPYMPGPTPTPSRTTSSLLSRSTKDIYNEIEKPDPEPERGPEKPRRGRPRIPLTPKQKAQVVDATERMAQASGANWPQTFREREAYPTVARRLRQGHSVADLERAAKRCQWMDTPHPLGILGRCFRLWLEAKDKPKAPPGPRVPSATELIRQERKEWGDRPPAWDVGAEMAGDALARMRNGTF